MIAIEEYRARIGCFCTRRGKLKCSKSPRHTQACVPPLYFYDLLQTFIMFIFLISLKFNVNMAFMKLAMLMMDGDIESNPGPGPSSYTIQKSVLGSFHQAHVKFGDTAGIQCSCNAMYAMCFSLIKKVSVWKSWDLDYILDHGDVVFKMVDISRSLFMSELPDCIAIENNNVNIEMLANYYGCLGQNKIFVDHSQTDIGNGLIFTTGGYSFSLIWSKNSIFLFDSHSRDSNGSFTDQGTSVALSFKTLNDVEKYIKTEYSKQLSSSFNDTQFEIQYVRVMTSAANVAAISDSINKLKKKVVNKAMYQKIIGTPQHEEIKSKQQAKCSEIFGTPKHDKMKKQKCARLAKIFGTPEHEKIKGQKRAKRASLFGTPEHEEAKKKRCTKYSSIIGTPEHEALKKQKRNSYHRKRHGKTSIERISRFTDLIKEGPYYICVVCNRCHYHRSVLTFKFEKYIINIDNFYREVLSSDGKLYICRTCHKKLKKSEIPAQAVSNKLDIFDFPDDLANMNRLERVIISRRILFKKVTIMPKGQAPKLKGSICNVPVNTNDVANTLPQGADSSGILMVKLKRKLMYRGHVFFEAVSPDVVRSALQYLKQNNPLYCDIEIDIGQIPDYLLSLAEPIDIPIEVEVDNDVPYSVNIPEDADNPLDNFRFGATETMLVSNIPQVEDIVIAPGEGIQPMSLLMDEKCEELAHPHLFPTGKFGYRVKREVKLSPVKYFNQRLLNYKQKFSSDSDYIFYALSVVQQLNLNSQINIAMKKMCTNQLTAGMLSNNFCDTVKSFIAKDEGYYSFMSPIKGTPAYWKKFLSEVLAMVKQLGLPTFFMTLSCADLRWNELIAIISKLKCESLSEEQINNMSYFERCSYLNLNPVLLARHFQYRVEVFFKEIIVDGPLGKVTYYAIRVEFQVRGSPHIHSLLWVLNAPVLSEDNIDEYVRFVDAVIKAYVPDINENPELHKLVTTYQIHSHSKSCRKYKNQECRYHFGRFFTDHTIIAVPLPKDLSEYEKTQRLEQRKFLLDKVAAYINTNLNPKKCNIINPEKDNFEQVSDIKDILQELGISEQEYYEALSTSSDADFQIHLKRPPNSCFVNNYFDEGLLAWKANIDIQPVFNHYKAVTYMCAYFSKSEDGVSEAMNQAAKEAFNSNKSNMEQMRSIARAYNTKRECSVQEAVYLLMPELWLRKTFPGVVFANSNLPENRYRISVARRKLMNSLKIVLIFLNEI